VNRSVRFSFTSIVLLNLLRRPLRCFCLAALTSALACILFGGTLITYSATNGTEGLARRLGADILVLPAGYDKMVEGILLRGESSSAYMDARWTEKIAAVQGVGAVSPQLFITSLNAACCSLPVQIIGFDQDSDFIIGSWIRTAAPSPLTQKDIVVGGAVSGRVGDTLTFFDRDYRIAAKMENTGTGFDGSIFMTLEAAGTAAADYAKKGGAATPPDNAVSAITALVDSGVTPYEAMQAIHRAYGYGNGEIVVVPAKTIVSNVSVGLRALSGVVRYLSGAVWLSAFAVLALVFSVIIHERKREFGILRALGAGKKQLCALILAESGLISLAGGLAGVLAAALLVLPFQTFIRETIEMPYMEPSLGEMLSLGLVAWLLTFAVGPSAALLAVAKIGRGDTWAVIRDGET
jgi:putative ABC transport system permease protein